MKRARSGSSALNDGSSRHLKAVGSCILYG
ncbi:MAG: hypothetical protein IAE89_11920 [Anaerolineae bacterium]|nr:hypothetical protein [Anaerolineae bacterium]